MIEIAEEKVKPNFSEKVKLDEIMRLLFDMSKPVLVDMLNSLFNENFDPDSVEITQENAKFVNEQLEVIEGDLFLRLDSVLTDKPYYFHLEFQTFEDKTMAIRVFLYDISEAVKIQKYNGETNGKTVLFMPKSLVIHVEKSDNIPDKYTLEIIFADGDKKEFEVGAIKFWQFSEEQLIKQKLYPLLPLRIFLLRDELDKMTKKGDETARQAAILKAKDIAIKIAETAKELNKSGLLVNADYRKVCVAIANLFTHLNNRYEVKEKLNEEVSSMVLLDIKGAEYYRAEGKAEGKAEGALSKALEMAKKLLKRGLNIKDIAEDTGLPEDEILKLN